MSDWTTYLSENRDHFQAEFFDFLRVPSISALPDHTADVQRAAEWVATRMAATGLEHIQIMPTGGHPVVYGDWLHAEGKPTILFYGHFDVQPVDPLDLWETPPFEPTVRDGRVYARGASDMKSSLVLGLVAMEALLKTEGALPVNIKCLFEGQEEIGSPQLPDFVAAQRDLLACDLVINADGGMWSETQPSLTIGSKGVCGLQIEVRGANGDLHSGIYGGAVPNPITALVRLLASMRDAEGRIVVEGFYDDVVPLSENDRARITAVPFDEAAYKASIGVSELVQEPGYTPQEHLWGRPTLEINGIWGGFQGAGIKTVLPGEAHAKITCRLVPNQNPETIRRLLIAHIERHRPPGVQISVQSLSIGGFPYLIPADHWANRVAADLLNEVYGQPPYYVRTGGSVPVLELFHRHLGAHCVTVGFSIRDEQIHAPNEFLRLTSFERGPGVYARLLHGLAQASG